MVTKVISKKTGADFAGFEDTRLGEFTATTNYESHPRLNADAYSSGNRQRSLFRCTSFSNGDIAGPVTVSGSTLRIVMRLAGSGTNSFSIYKVTSAPTFTEATWNNRTTANAWTAAGGDYDATALATVTNIATGANMDFSSSALNSLVEGWINGTINNYGVIILRTGESFDTLEHELHSSEAGAGETVFPEWSVDYTAGTGATVSTITGTTVTEGSPVVFTTTMSGTGGGTFAYSWSGTATAADYTSTLTTGMCAVTGGSGSVTVSGSNITVDSTVTAFTVTVPTTTDTIDEGASETIRLVVGGVTASSGTITDDDSAPDWSVSNAAPVTAGSPAIFTLTADRASSLVQNYTIGFIDGTLVGGTGYDNTITNPDLSNGVTISAGVLSIPAGVTSFTVSVGTT
jgi:hypothetical protein